ncbi:MAG: ABC transporter ATP-binding protein [Methylococcales bacterium]
MSYIRATDIVVDFPIYGGSNRSLKKVIMRTATGGILAQDSQDKVIVRALDNISFEFTEGDRVGLLGHNGAGKSTLLRLLAGIYEPSQGQIEVHGSISSMLNITLGMDYEATGMENIYLRGHIMGIPPKKMRLLIDEIAEFTELGDYLHLPLRTYSSGMAMRLAFAVSTTVEADIILMDEWLSVGDVNFVEKAKIRMNDMVSNSRLIVLASHDRSLIESQCNKIYQLEHGKLTLLDKKTA